MQQQEVTLRALLERVATIFKLVHREDVPILKMLGKFTDTIHKISYNKMKIKSLLESIFV